MSIEWDIYLVLAGLAVATFVTRLSGILLMRLLPESRTVEAFVESLSKSVLVAVVAPVFYFSDLRAQLAIGFACVFHIFVKNMMLTIIAGSACLAALRYFF